jgi:hypothetical protein
VGHSNAPLTPEGRRRLCERVDAGIAICHIAAEAGIARQTLGKWYERWVIEGDQGLVDPSSRPECSPNQTAVYIEDRVEALRRERKLGPVQLMALLAAEGIEIAASTSTGSRYAGDLPAPRPRRLGGGSTRTRRPLRVGPSR